VQFQNGLEFSGGGLCGFFFSDLGKHLKKYIKPNWNLQKERMEGLEKYLSDGEVWTFSGTKKISTLKQNGKK